MLDLGLVMTDIFTRIFGNIFWRSAPSLLNERGI